MQGGPVPAKGGVAVPAKGGGGGEVPVKGVAMPITNDDSDEDVPDAEQQLKRIFSTRALGIRAFDVHGSDIAKGLYASSQMSSSVLAMLYLKKVTLAHFDRRRMEHFIEGIGGAHHIHLAMDEFVNDCKTKSARVNAMDPKDPQYLEARHMAMEATCALARFRAGLQDVFDRLRDPLGWKAPDHRHHKAATIDWLKREAVDIKRGDASFWGEGRVFEDYGGIAKHISEIEIDERPVGLERVQSTDEDDNGVSVYEMETLVVVVCGEEGDKESCFGISLEVTQWGPDPTDVCGTVWRTRAHGKHPMRYQNCPHCGTRLNMPFHIFTDTACSVMVFIPPWMEVNEKKLANCLGVPRIFSRTLVRGTGEPLTAAKLQLLLGDWWWLFSDDSTGGARFDNINKKRDSNTRLAAAQYTNAYTSPPL